MFQGGLCYLILGFFNESLSVRNLKPAFCADKSIINTAYDPETETVPEKETEEDIYQFEQIDENYQMNLQMSFGILSSLVGMSVGAEKMQPELQKVINLTPAVYIEMSAYML